MNTCTSHVYFGLKWYILALHVARKDGGNLQTLQTKVEPLGGFDPTLKTKEETSSHSVLLIASVLWTHVRKSQSKVLHHKWPLHDDLRKIDPESFIILDVWVRVQAWPPYCLFIPCCCFAFECFKEQPRGRSSKMTTPLYTEGRNWTSLNTFLEPFLDPIVFKPMTILWNSPSRA